MMIKKLPPEFLESLAEEMGLSTAQAQKHFLRYKIPIINTIAELPAYKPKPKRRHHDRQEDNQKTL